MTASPDRSPTPHPDVDLFVIGGGSGGVRAARIAATHGARVALAEEYRYGGTCVIRGCVPKKLMVYAGRFGEAFRDAAGFGWKLDGSPRHDWAALVAAKEREITRLEGLYEGNLERAGVQVLRTRAVLDGPGRVRLADGTVVKARHILIATGGTPVWPDIPGAQLGITSNEIFDLPALPATTVICGAGYIALEFASILAHLGSTVHVVHRGPRLLRGFDGELAARLQAALEERGVRFHLNSTLQGIVQAANGRRMVTLTQGSQIEADQILFALGRRANVQGLGLETAGLHTDARGAIPVDAFSRTAVEGIHAVGDVTGRVELTPVAIREGHALADTLFGDQSWTADHTLIPTAVFTTPEIGTVGLHEDNVLEHHPLVDVYRSDFRSMQATLSGSSERVLMKLLVEVSGQRVVGAQIMGPDAGELVQVLATLLRMGATKQDFDRTMPLHPSAAEELMTLRTPARRLMRAAPTA